MRIIGGLLKGRVLQSPDGRGTRPTDARAREMLFNILGEQVIEARVLDLYGGTGALGLEALSRGAEFCIFIEQNAGACRAIKANLQVLGVAGVAQVWQSSVRSALRRLAADGESFDLVLADPPFGNPRELADLCKALDTAASLLHNKARRQPATSSTPGPNSPRSSDAPHTAPDGAREQGQADEVPLVPSASSQVLAPDDLVWSGARDEEWDAEPEPAADPEPFEPMLVIQHHRKQAPVLQAPFRLWREKRAGESTFSFFVLDASDEAGESEGKPEAELEDPLAGS